MRRLMLIRPGLYGSRHHGMPDKDCPLSPWGKKQALDVARNLAYRNERQDAGSGKSFWPHWREWAAVLDRLDHFVPEILTELPWRWLVWRHLDGPTVVYSSRARRARETAVRFAAVFWMRAERIHLMDSLYTTSPEKLLEELRAMDDGDKHAAVICHNPAISKVAEYLADLGDPPSGPAPCGAAAAAAETLRWQKEALKDLPTCAIVRLDVKCASWRDLAPEACFLRELRLPGREPEAA